MDTAHNFENKRVGFMVRMEGMMNSVHWQNWAMLVWVALLLTSHLTIVVTWWSGYLGQMGGNGWPPIVGEHWVEGVIWHGMVLATPFAVWWLIRRLRG